MSRSARITLPFGDGKHTFLLDIEGLEELQEQTGLGPEELYRRLGDGTWPKPACIREPLRIGLVRAGMSPIAAMVLVDRYAGPGWLLENIKFARMVILAALIGASDEDKPPHGSDLGETSGEASGPSASPTESGASATSTKSAE